MSPPSLFAATFVAFNHLIASTVAIPNAALESVVKPLSSGRGGCRFVPTDPQWPSLQAWASLNQTVGGRLIATIPIGSPCFETTSNVKYQKTNLKTYDEKRCTNIRDNWYSSEIHIESSSSIMQTYFTNNSCNPISPGQSGGRCGIGSYVQYAIDVGSDDDAKAGIAFGRKHNIRVLVRNTGYDYLGKSTGYGALALWTHHLNEISPIIQFKNKQYNGPALKVSAGVSVGEVYDTLERQGYTALGGEGPSVGLAGGYIFAGGHSAASSKLGLAADQILEVEGILANGTSFVASPNQNLDIFWFLSGSGAGGTIAYIKNVTFKVFNEFPVSGALLTLPFKGILSDDEFWSLLEIWHSITPKITDAGAYAYAFYMAGYFQLRPLFAPELSEAQAVALLKPLLDHIDKLKVKHPSLKYNLTSSSYPTFDRAYKGLFPAFESPGSSFQWTSRLIPRATIEKQPKEVIKTFKKLYDEGAVMNEAVMNPNLKVAKPVIANSVLPAWRTASMHLVVAKPYNDSAPFQTNVDARTFITEHWTSALEELAPASAGGGTYMNEADAEDPHWQESLYGANYPRQLAIKKKYDPSGFWYAKTAVGSEYWGEDEQQRLCPKKPTRREM